MVSVGKAPGRGLNHEGVALMNGIMGCALKEETPEKSLTPSTMRALSEKALAMNQEGGPHQRTEPS